MWYRLVAGVNAQLRTVRKGSKSTTLMPVIMWLETHANPWLFDHNVRVDLAWCQSTASGYYQLGLVLNSSDEVPQYFQPSDMLTLPRSPGRYVRPFEWLLSLINPLQPSSKHTIGMRWSASSNWGCSHFSQKSWNSYEYLLHLSKWMFSSFLNDNIGAPVKLIIVFTLVNKILSRVQCFKTHDAFLTTHHSTIAAILR